MHEFNDYYDGSNLDRIAFPVGGIGTGCICVEGSGHLSHVSLRHKPDVFKDSEKTFAAIGIKGRPDLARVLEGPVPRWRVFGPAGSGNGSGNSTFGLPRFASARFLGRFPFASVELSDKDLPYSATITAWSPFTPPNPDDSSLPVAILEYTISNTSAEHLAGTFTFSLSNLVRFREGGEHGIRTIKNGIVAYQEAGEGHAEAAGEIAVVLPVDSVARNGAWFRGGWFDGLTIAWNEIASGAGIERDAVAFDSDGGPAASGAVSAAIDLAPGDKTTLPVIVSWHVPQSDLCHGPVPPDASSGGSEGESCGCGSAGCYRPWYAGKFAGAEAVASYVTDSFDSLKERSAAFRDSLFATTLPQEIVEAVAANLSILKSPTVLRQEDGRFWGYEGCNDSRGCCAGSCTHVWNYAQAVASLFPSLERSLRETEFGPSQNDEGHQDFRAALPIRETAHRTLAAADGQLGDIIRAYRDWRVSGDTEWARFLWPRIKQSLEFCIAAWDPEETGQLVEPHHNTYERCLAAMHDGEYYMQTVQIEGLQSPPPEEVVSIHDTIYRTPEDREMLAKEGPKYQYGSGCLSDQVIGEYFTYCSGLGGILDDADATSALKSIFKYNYKTSLVTHVNPQRPTYALGSDGGLLLCSWPRGGKPSLPFVYSDEVWTGIEYQVAAHSMFRGLTEQGTAIVRAARSRYDGRDRNPFNEYECGHWYARALASYALLSGMSGARYDAVERVLFLSPTVAGDFTAFICTESGFGRVGVRSGEPFLEEDSGAIQVEEVRYTPCAQ